MLELLSNDQKFEYLAMLEASSITRLQSSQFQNKVHFNIIFQTQAATINQIIKCFAAS